MRPTIRISTATWRQRVTIHAHLFGDLRFGGVAFHFGREFARDRLQLLVAFTQIARRPIHVAKAVENRAFDPVLRVAMKADLLLAVVLERGVEQTHDSGVDEVVDIDMNRQALVHSYGDRPHQRKVFQDEFIALGFGCIWFALNPESHRTGWKES